MKNYTFAVIGFLLFLISCAKEENEAPKNCSDYTFRELQLEYNQPNCINFLFQVLDQEGGGVPGLLESDFTVLENGQEVGSEAGVTIVPNNQIDFRIQTVLLIDVSISVKDNIDQIKEAAISMVNRKAENQQIAVYTFSSNLDKVLDFDNDKNSIINAINSISVGSSSTNLYGALTGVSNLYTDEINLMFQFINAGNIVLFTDGDDTQASSSLSNAQSAMSGKDLYIVALNGSDFNESTREVMNSLDPIKLLEASDASQLTSLFNEIVNNIINLSNSTYWLYFSSPKRGNSDHQLQLEFSCESNSNTISGTFNSADFTDGTCAAVGSGSFSCVSGECEQVNNGDFSSLDECESNCGSNTNYECVNGNCETDPNGTYSTFDDCTTVCDEATYGPIIENTGNFIRDFDFTAVSCQDSSGVIILEGSYSQIKTLTFRFPSNTQSGTTFNLNQYSGIPYGTLFILSIPPPTTGPRGTLYYLDGSVTFTIDQQQNYVLDFSGCQFVTSTQVVEYNSSSYITCTP